MTRRRAAVVALIGSGLALLFWLSVLEWLRAHRVDQPSVEMRVETIDGVSRLCPQGETCAAPAPRSTCPVGETCVMTHDGEWVADGRVTSRSLPTLTQSPMSIDVATVAGVPDELPDGVIVVGEGRVTYHCSRGMSGTDKQVCSICLLDVAANATTCWPAATRLYPR